MRRGEKRTAMTFSYRSRRAWNLWGCTVQVQRQRSAGNQSHFLALALKRRAARTCLCTAGRAAAAVVAPGWARENNVVSVNGAVPPPTHNVLLDGWV